MHLKIVSAVTVGRSVGNSTAMRLGLGIAQFSRFYYGSVVRPFLHQGLAS